MQRLAIDEYWLLTIDHTEIQNTKEYRYNFSWYSIISQDKWILVYNKRQWRIIHLKEVSEGMQIAYIQQNEKVNNAVFDKVQVRNVLSFFSWFNEETWEHYAFIPYYSSEIEKKLEEFRTLYSFEIVKEKMWVVLRGIEGDFQKPSSQDEILSFIYVITQIYWKFEGKGNEVASFKAHIPSFWRYNAWELLWEYFKNLHKFGIFLSWALMQNGGKSIFQYHSSDSELLELFVNWNNTINKNNLRLTKYNSKQQEIKNQLLEYIHSSAFDEIEITSEISTVLEQSCIKFLKYA